MRNPFFLKRDSEVFHNAGDRLLVGIRYIFLDVGSPILSSHLLRAIATRDNPAAVPRSHGDWSNCALA